jgi:hypothetical protein
MQNVVASLPDPSQVLLFMGSKKEDLPGIREEDAAMETAKYTCSLTGPIADQSSLPLHRYRLAIASHLSSMCYNNADMFANTLRKVTEREVAKLSLVFFRSLTCHPDHGGHRYMASSLKSNSRSRDRSWVKVREESATWDRVDAEAKVPFDTFDSTRCC